MVTGDGKESHAGCDLLTGLVYQDKDFERVSKTLQTIPQTGDMMSTSQCELKKTLDRRDQLAYPLLQW